MVEEINSVSNTFHCNTVRYDGRNKISHGLAMGDRLALSGSILYAARINSHEICTFAAVIYPKLRPTCMLCERSQPGIGLFKSYGEP